ncbi:hypothetical protein [Labilibaculum euxinus]
MMKLLVSICLLFVVTVSYGQVGVIVIPDTRDVPSLPTNYNHEMKIEFKRRSGLGVPGSGNFSGLLTIAPWEDNSGCMSHQLNFNDGGLYYRNGLPDSNAWGLWKSILMAEENGNVGIGTKTPNGKLHIKGTGSHDLVMENAGIGFSAENNKWPDLVLARWEKYFLDLTNWGSGDAADATVFRISANQTEGKEATLALVRGSKGNLEFLDFYNNGYADATQYGIRIQKRGTGAYRDFVFDQYDGTTSQPLMILKKTGNVGIGMNNPDPNAKLDVAGTIRATEIKVEAQTADFVFEDDYQLRPLIEVEQFIHANKHLPDIPSAKEMKEDGVGLAEMNKLLLQKVEELTLYSIEMEKARKKEQSERESLKEEMKFMKSELQTIKKLVSNK